MSHQTEIAASLVTLEGELARLDALIASQDADSAAKFSTVRDHILRAVSDLRGLAEVPAALPPAGVEAAVSQGQALLAHRMIPPGIRTEAFRTRVTIKATVKPLAQADEPPAAVIAQGTEPAQMPPAADDLTRIRGIDKDLSVRLREIGITTFTTLAGINGDDVRRVSEQLGLGRQISRQNWIEQAALLSRSAAQSTQPARVEAPAIAELEAAHSIEKPAVEEAVAAAAAQITPLPVSDRLDLIKGLDNRCLVYLSTLGITRWSEIAAWSRSDIDQVEQALGIPGAVARGNWIEQAALLASTGNSAFAKLKGWGLIDVVSGAEAEPPRTVAPLLERLAAATMPGEQPPSAILEAKTLVAAGAAGLPADYPAIDHDSLVFLPGAPSSPPEPTSGVVEPSDQFKEPATAKLPAQPIAIEIASAGADDTDTPPAASTLPDIFYFDTAEESVAVTQTGSPRPADNIEDEEFGELSVEEAEVMIVQRRPAAARPQPGLPLARRATRSLLSRLVRTTPLDDIDPANYAAYRDQIEEATVEIVRRGARKEAGRE